MGGKRKRQEEIAPSPPQTPQKAPFPSPRKRTTTFGAARRAFARGADPGVLVGRGKERAEVHKFINDLVGFFKGGALYVSGPPGTGKSALVTEVCRTLGTSDIRYAHVNCMSIKSATDIYALAASELGISDDVFEGGAREALRTCLLKKNGKVSYLVVLDEIDQILNLDHSVLYDFFEWCFAPGSKLILIGIANALDLTDRFLPRLKSRNLKPDLLPFLPYTASEVATVLTARCRSLLPANSTSPADFTPFIHPTAIQLISKKVASQTGDLRKSFDIAMRAIELIESETKENLAKQVTVEHDSLRSSSKTPLGENPNISSPRSPMVYSPNKKPKLDHNQTTIISQLTPETAPRATLAHVVRVTSVAFGNSLLQRFKALNLQQKAILCSLAALEHKNRQIFSMPSPQTPERGSSNPSTPTKSKGQAAPRMRDLREAYTSLCRRDNILHALSSTEFRDVVANLETASLVAAVDGKAGSLAMQATPTNRKGRGSSAFGSAKGDERRLSTRIGIQDLESGIDGVGSDILKNILLSSAP